MEADVVDDETMLVCPLCGEGFDTRCWRHGEVEPVERKVHVTVYPVMQYRLEEDQ